MKQDEIFALIREMRTAQQTNSETRAELEAKVDEVLEAVKVNDEEIKTLNKEHEMPYVTPEGERPDEKWGKVIEFNSYQGSKTYIQVVGNRDVYIKTVDRYGNASTMTFQDGGGDTLLEFLVERYNATERKTIKEWMEEEKAKGGEQ